MKGLIVYKGRYGATMQYAVWLGAMLQLPVVKSDFLQEDQLAAADYVLVGTSVYIGRLQISKWLRTHAKLLAGKKLLFFIVAGSAPDETEKLDAYYEKGVPAPLRIAAERFYLPGQLNFRQLSLQDKILLKVGAWLAAKRGEKIGLADYNRVAKENLRPILAVAHTFDKQNLPA